MPPLVPLFRGLSVQVSYYNRLHAIRSYFTLVEAVFETQTKLQLQWAKTI